MTAPVLFISHGAPTFALEPGKLGARLHELGKALAGVEAVLVVSPHWQTPGLRVMANESPATLHDFGGFPRALYGLQYPAPGHLAFAVEASRLLIAAGFAAEFDNARGRDHGAWVPLLHLLPEATTPVFQVSMPYALDAAGAWRLGQALAPLRRRGVMLVGAGSMTHNLGEFSGAAAGEAAYVGEFVAWVRAAVQDGATDALLDYRRRAPHAMRAHPTEEHFLPLLVAAAAADGSPVQVFDGGTAYGRLSMESYAWGAPAAGA